MRQGMTIVELLAATLLASLLMTAVLGVLKGVTRNQRAVLREGADVGWKSRLAAQLEWDLTNSRTYSSTSSGFELRGFAGRNPTSGLPDHRSTDVHYEVVGVAKDFCLVRTEAQKNSTTSEGPVRELVCQHIERVTLSPPEGATTQPASGRRDQTIGDDTPIPQQAVVAIYSPGLSDPVFRRAFNLR